MKNKPVKKRGIRRKILTSYLILIVFAFSALGAGIYFPLKNYFVDNLKNDMVNQAYLTNQFIYSDLIEKKYEDLQTKLDKISVETDSRISIVLKNGDVVSDTEVSPINLENHANREEVKWALKGEVGVEKRFSNSTKREMLYVAIPIYVEEEIYGVIRISYGIEFISDFLKNYRLIFILGMILASLIAFLVSLKVSKSLTEPIENVNRDVKAISAGNLDKEIYSAYENELGELAENVNNMKGNLKEKINEADEEKSRLENIITTMASGVIVLDEKARIIMINNVAESIFKITKSMVLNKPIYESIRNFSIMNYVDQCIEDGTIIEEEVLLYEPYENHLKVSFAPVYKENKISGITILLNDVTEEKRLAKLKSDFVANASHELRTPLTAVKGYAETLLNGAWEDSSLCKKFIGIIDAEANRLILLVDDLMTLSSAESARDDSNKEIVDLVEISRLILDSFTILAAEKGIEIKLQLDKQKDHYCLGNAERIKQVLAILLDNAIKYSPENSDIELALSEIEDEVIISVKDNGIGIDKSEVDRVFERFYRVDKSRSKKNGGFGLGLSIAKNIVENMSGKIWVESEPGKGSIFSVSFQNTKKQNI